MKSKIKQLNILTALDGTCTLVCTLDGKLHETMQNAVYSVNESLKSGKAWEITVDRVKKQRGLSANAYFHLLAGKIAEVLKTSIDEVKSDIVTSYGVPLYAVTLPDGENVFKIWKYAKYIGENEKGDEYLLFKATHECDTVEMARLIDGIIHEAQELGIETATPEELAKIKEKL